MDELEKYQSQQVVQSLAHKSLAHFEVAAGFDDDSSPSLVTPIIRRWRIVLLTSLLMCLVGIPAVWYLVKPSYQATAAIRIAPVIPSILFGDSDSDSVIPMYDNFKNTQAEMIKSDRVLQRVADDLANKNLAFFGKVNDVSQLPNDNRPETEAADPVDVLRKALNSGILKVTPERRSELIKIVMKSANPEEAAQIVNSFVNAYMAIEGSNEARRDDRKLTLLENERKVLAEKLERQRRTIQQLAEEYGATVLTDRQEIMLQRVASLQNELTTIQTRRITIDAKLQLLEETEQQEVDPDRMLKLKYEFVNSNPMVQVLANNVTELEQGLIVARQTLAQTNPELKRKAELLDALTTRLEEKRQELEETFERMMSEELAKSRLDQLASLKAEAGHIANYEKRLQDMLTKENADTIELGRKHLAIQDQQEQLSLTKELYGTVRRRIQELEMERKRPARISVAYDANIAPVPSKRIKYTAALMFSSLAFGMLLAILIGRADRSLYTPNDIVKRVGVRIIGTTTSGSGVKESLLPQQVADDYQTILANLGLLNGDGIPNKLVITSAGVRDGKTTFAINLATTLAKAGRKVLLVDGDLRKPDIGGLLNLPKSEKDLQDVLIGQNPEEVIKSFPAAGFDVLTMNSGNATDCLRLLSLPRVGEFLNAVSRRYDHVVVDTAPVLAFPDALLWAKIADGVILTSLAGHTADEDLRETLERLRRVGANVLGTILNSVHIDYSYNRYGYGYYSGQTRSKSSRRSTNSTKLLLPLKENPKPPKESKS
ncbi:MAG: GumC family protein [Planctomycetota bacterium]|jgi:capsular exopolysaccharide synthesis family protein